MVFFKQNECWKTTARLFKGAFNIFKSIFDHLLKTLENNFNFKGTVRSISSDFPFKEEHPRFTTLNLRLIKDDRLFFVFFRKACNC